MTQSTAIVSTDAVNTGHRCVEIEAKQAAVLRVNRTFREICSQFGRSGNKMDVQDVKKCYYSRYGLFRKIHIMETRLTHRPTNRMMQTILEFVRN